MSSLKRVLEYTKKYKTRLILSMIFASLFGLMAAAPTYLLRHTVDEVFIKSYSHLIIPFIIGFVLLFILKAVFMYLTSYFMYWVGNRVINDIRTDLFAKIAHFPISFFQEKTSGQLMSHFLNDIQMIQNTISLGVKDGVRSLFEGAFLIGVALFMNWQLALIMAIVGPIIVITTQRLGKARKKASLGIQQEMGKISNMLQESFTGIREIKAFNGENIEVGRFKGLLTQCFRSIMRNVKIEAFAPALIEPIGITGGGVVFYFAAQQVLTGIITAGALISFFGAVILAYQPIKKIVSFYSEVQYGIAAADRIFEIIDRVYPATKNRSLELIEFKAEINFKDVAFAYNSNSFVFKNANLQIKHGECVGIIGASGSGKSTMCDMLLGFVMPTQGNVLIDGMDITQISLSSLRNKIGYVGQRTFLFNDTIYNNVAYAQSNVTHEEVVNACKLAHAEEFIKDLPQGYQTIVGENGTLLSGGQKQRITIARALLKSPEILIFDEATSALDQESEKIIQQAIFELKGQKTLIIVSHRPAMLKNVDKIFSINSGQVRAIQTSSFRYEEGLV
ncbi:MAG: ABC transporter, ATP-binding protein [candidate division TM6 bacterium GW2011_GWF2_37_49]|nr:MAG: ABC transporter, ATP-binding protein [candidate division TM6 bacterium GW2011_GWF2_37_49]